MALGRWIFFLIATWAVIAVWTEDPLARLPDYNRFYWLLLGLVAVAALVFELRDLRQSTVSARQHVRPGSEE